MELGQKKQNGNPDDSDHSNRNNNHNKNSNNDENGGKKNQDWNSSSHSSDTEGPKNQNHLYSTEETPCQLTLATEATSTTRGSVSVSVPSSVHHPRSRNNSHHTMTPMRPRQLDPARFDDHDDRIDALTSTNTDANTNTNTNTNTNNTNTNTEAPEFAADAGIQQLQSSLRRLQNVMLATASGSILSLAFVLATVLPPPAGIAFALSTFLSLSTLALVRQYLMQYWNYQVGVFFQQQPARLIHQFLPERLYQLLTQETMHAFLTDDSFIREHRHLLLYLLPLSPSARQHYLHRLAPRQVERLHRPGLGHWFLSPDAMRQLFGEQQQRVLPPPDSSVIPSRRRRLQQPTTRPALEVIVERTATSSSRSGSASATMNSSTRHRLLDQVESTNGDVEEEEENVSSSSDHMILGIGMGISMDVSNDSLLTHSTHQLNDNNDNDNENDNNGVSAVTPMVSLMNGGASLSPLLTLHRHATEYASGTGHCNEKQEENVEDGTDDDDNTDNGEANDEDKDEDEAIRIRALTTEEEEYAEEEVLLTEAINTAFADTVLTPASNYFRSAVRGRFESITNQLLPVGLAIGLGIVGYNHRSDISSLLVSRPSHALHHVRFPSINTTLRIPSSSEATPAVFYTTIMVGLAGIGCTLLYRQQQQQKRRKGS